MSAPTANPISTISGQSSASNYGFVDPYGTSSALQSALYGGTNPLATNAQSIAANAAGQTGQLQNLLSQTAAYQAQNALNTTASNFANQGALGSGAAAQAFGQAIANPFAQAQAQLQQSQLGAYSSALSNAYNSNLQGASNLMEHASGLVAPTYYTNPEYTQQAGKQQQASGLGKGAGASAGSQLLGPTLGGLGSGLSNALGLGAGSTAGKATPALSTGLMTLAA